MKKRIISAGLFLALQLSLLMFLSIGCSDDATPTTSAPPSPPSGQSTITAVTGNTAAFSRMDTVLTVAQLDSILDMNSKGPFTVFVPVNTAFVDLDSATLENLHADSVAAKSFAQCHIVSGKFTTAQLASMDSIRTVNGQMIRIKTVNNVIVLNDSCRIVNKDMTASNGMVQGVDRVIVK